MAIFAKDVNERGTNGSTQQGEGVLSLIGAGMKVVGDIDTTGVVKVEGTIEGCIRNARQVLLGRQGEIIGDIHARDVVLGGRVSGTIYASERVEVQGTASVVGDIQTKSIVVLEGARVNGAVKMEGSATTAGRNDEQDDDVTPMPAVAVMR
jgi:cytoskeletal protein CcmA (bactofilin family)